MEYCVLARVYKVKGINLNKPCCYFTDILVIELDKHTVIILSFWKLIMKKIWSDVIASNRFVASQVSAGVE